MNEALLVGMMQADGCLADEFAGQRNRQRSGLGNQLAQIDAIDIFHCQITSFTFRGEVVDGNDVWMGQLRRRLGLAEEALEHVSAREAFRVDDLDRSNAPKPAVKGLEHLAHAARADPFEKDVGTEDKFPALALENLV